MFKEALDCLPEGIKKVRLRSDTAGYQHDFGENAVWWPACAMHADRWIMILARNLNAMMKKFSMEESCLPKRMKAIRFSFINLPGHAVTRSRNLIIRLSKNNPALELLINARKKIGMLQTVPFG